MLSLTLPQTVELSGLRSFSSLRDALAFCQSQLVRT